MLKIVLPLRSRANALAYDIHSHILQHPSDWGRRQNLINPNNLQDRSLAFALALVITAAAYNEAMNRRMFWTSYHAKNLVEHTLDARLEGWSSVDHETMRVTRHFQDMVIEPLLTDVHSLIQQVMPYETWATFTVRRIGQDIVAEQGEDYRILAWMDQNAGKHSQATPFRQPAYGSELGESDPYLTTHVSDEMLQALYPLEDYVRIDRRYLQQAEYPSFQDAVRLHAILVRDTSTPKQRRDPFGIGTVRQISRSGSYGPSRSSTGAMVSLHHTPADDVPTDLAGGDAFDESNHVQLTAATENVVGKRNIARRTREAKSV